MASIYNILPWNASDSYNLNDIVSEGGEYYYNITPGSNSVFSQDYFGGYKQVNALNLPNFLWNPSYGSSILSKSKLKTIDFGDGYHQTIVNIIKNNLLEFDLIFDKRSDSETRAILHFLRARKGVQPFFWTPNEPFDEIKIFKCLEWNHTRIFFDNNTITAKFSERPLGVTISLPPIIVEPPPTITTKLIGVYDMNAAQSESTHANIVNYQSVSSILYPGFITIFGPAFYGQLAQLGNPTSAANYAGPPAAPGHPYFPINLQGYRYMSTFDGDTVNARWLSTSSDFIPYSLTSLSSKTFAGWYSFKTSSVVKNIFGKDNTSSRGYWLSQDSATSITWHVYDNGGAEQTVNITTPTSLSGKWVFFSCGYDALLQKAFLKIQYILTPASDFVSASAYSASIFTPNTSTAKFMVLRTENSTNPYYAYNSMVALIAVWDRLLTDEETDNLYNKDLITKQAKGKSYPFS